MKKNTKITEKEMIDMVEKYLNQFDNGDSGERSTAAEILVSQVALYGGNNHYECLGILQEAMLKYREISLEVLNELD